jgi:hypothetical protein
MSDETKEFKSWGSVSAVAILLAIAVGLIYYYVTKDWLVAIGLPILILGVYETISSLFRSTQKDRYGTSESGAAVLLGFMAMSIGGAIVIFKFADSIIIPIVFIILIMALYVVVSMALKKRA